MSDEPEAFSRPQLDWLNRELRAVHDRIDQALGLVPVPAVQMSRAEVQEAQNAFPAVVSDPSLNVARAWQPGGLVAGAVGMLPGRFAVPADTVAGAAEVWDTTELQEALAAAPAVVDAGQQDAPKPENFQDGEHPSIRAAGLGSQPMNAALDPAPLELVEQRALPLVPHYTLSPDAPPAAEEDPAQPHQDGTAAPESPHPDAA